MSPPGYIPSFYFYKFAEGIASPYTSMQAYKGGAIDENGNIIKPESSIEPLEYLIIKLKKIFDEIPMGMTRAKLNNYLTTLQLFSEEAAQFGITTGEYAGLMEGHLALAGYPEVSAIELMEDMGAGGMATPASSPGYNTGSVSGNDPIMGPMQRRGPVLKGLDKCTMFDVCPEELKHFQSASDWRYVPESETKKYVRRFGLRNPDGYLALRSVDPDTNKANIHWINFNKKSLKEDVTMLDEAKKSKNPSSTPKPTSTPKPKGVSSRIAEAHALEAFAHHLETLGGYTDPNTQQIYDAVLHPVTKEPLRSYKRRPYLTIDPKTNLEVVDTTPLSPGEFRISAGGRGVQDVEIKDFEHPEGSFQGPLEIKSMTRTPRHNVDVSRFASPRSQAAYLAVARGLGFPESFRRQINPPESENTTPSTPQNIGKWKDILRKELTDLAGMASLGLVGEADVGTTKGVRRKELKKGIGQRAYDIVKKLFIRGFGKEKGGLLFGINPEDRQMSIIDMVSDRSQQEREQLQRMMENMGGLQIGGTLASENYSVDTKMTKETNGKNMVRMDVKEVQSKVPQLETVRKANGEVAFGHERVGNKWINRPRTSMTKEQSQEIMHRLTH